MKRLLPLFLVAFSAYPQLGSFVGSTGSGASPNYNITVVTSGTSLSLDATSHQIGHGGILVSCRDSTNKVLAAVNGAPSAGQFSYTVE